MQTADILKITIGEFQAEASGQMAIAALLVIAGLYLLRRDQ
ncbi:hypothetical protein [Rhizobium lentis]|nr:hypothetical protein [Rhizobium lentis]